MALKKNYIYYFLGILFTCLGVFHYILYRKVAALAIFEVLGVNVQVEYSPLSHGKGLEYFYWASFPSFCATIASYYYTRAIFSNKEKYQHLLFILVCMIVFEILGFFNDYDFLDIVSIIFAALFLIMLNSVEVFYGKKKFW